MIRSTATYVVPDRRDEPEEHEHEHLAEPGVAVRPWARRCRTTPRRSPPRRRRAATTTSSRRATRPATAATPNAAKAARLTAAGRLQPGGDEAQRADAGVVGAADAVAVVVGVVDADLQGEADDEGDGDAPPRHRAGADGAAGADGDRDDGGGQRARARAQQPGVHASAMMDCDADGIQRASERFGERTQHRSSITGAMAALARRPRRASERPPRRRRPARRAGVRRRAARRVGPRRGRLPRRPAPAPRRPRRRCSPTWAPARSSTQHGETALDDGWPVEPGDALVVATSGSTGVPKGVVLTHDAVAASAAGDRRPARHRPRTTTGWRACRCPTSAASRSSPGRWCWRTSLTVLPGVRPGARRRRRRHPRVARRHRAAPHRPGDLPHDRPRRRRPARRPPGRTSSRRTA